ncbi:MAG: hydroxymethylglutaryl-CoA lyase [Brevibacterium aurantiacum]|uniref:Hydroxymethylglutaryl-CoA lyase n=1 Tax=Brevibacterium aurantiacum TaxID=273384 RepID=A0A2H1KVW4_BREAU|nr:hydroxymethylglutaryl-CoA lyase [Brevibacterium aurantiacum]SMY03831.1 hydroxymethylglutaryl-CoA lyase [Brevibacterium aurantiacum]
MMGSLPQVFTHDDFPTQVRVYEVSARDGLQAESLTLPAEVRAQLISRLADSGLKSIEAGSFVSPQAVPQMADTRSVLDELDLDSDISYPVLVPNQRGLADAMSAGAKDIAVFVSVTEAFSRANLGDSLEVTTARNLDVAAAATSAGMRVRGYLSMVFGDPWEGPVDPQRVVTASHRLLEAGCSSLSLGDTIGTATPGHVTAVLQALIDDGIPVESIALHTHNTYGQALANVYAALQLGVTEFDASAGGVGGCPFAGSATGNLATEDLLWMLDGLGISTGVNIRAVAETSQWLSQQLGKPLASATSAAIVNQ